MGLFSKSVKIFVDGIRVDVKYKGDGVYEYETEEGKKGEGRTIEAIRKDVRDRSSQGLTNWFGQEGDNG
jgi:hypothetical protein